MTIQKFRQDNTHGYGDDDLRSLNELYVETRLLEGADGEDADKSHLDNIAERVQAAYDDGARFVVRMPDGYTRFFPARNVVADEEPLFAMAQITQAPYGDGWEFERSAYGWHARAVA